MFVFVPVRRGVNSLRATGVPNTWATWTACVAPGCRRDGGENHSTTCQTPVWRVGDPDRAAAFYRVVGRDRRYFDTRQFRERFGGSHARVPVCTYWSVDNAFPDDHVLLFDDAGLVVYAPPGEQPYVPLGPPARDPWFWASLRSDADLARV